MGDKTGIEWTEATWNPVTGCTKVSNGCKHCYAELEWARLAANPKTAYYGRDFGDVQCHADRLEQPLRWKKPRRIFVNSMSDLFHPDVPDDFLPYVFAMMAAAKDHTFQVLTKRAGRMREVINDGIFFEAVACCANALGVDLHADDWPLRNVWLGVSVEDQATADERIPLLLQTSAAVRWISVEPLLGPVDLTAHLWGRATPCADCPNDADCGCGWYPRGAIPDEPALNWVVVGGESGPKARPMHPDWARSLRDQCAAAGVPFLFKQWGEFAPNWLIDDNGNKIPGSEWVDRMGKKIAGRLLDGVLHDSYPR